MNRRGQALVEFILILPVLLLILFVLVDFGNILSNKNKLEYVSADIVDMYKNGDDISNIRNNYSDIEIKVSKYMDKYTKIVIKKEINIITPGLNRIIGNKYLIEVERVVSNA